MDSKEFVRGYQDISDRKPKDEESAEVKEIMTGPRMWASFFDTQLYDLLSGEQQRDAGETNRQLDEYLYDWLETRLDTTVKQTQGLAFYNEQDNSAVNELNFHILNKEFLDMWRRALQPETFPRLSHDHIETMQAKLAKQGANLRLVKEDAFYWQAVESTPKALVASLNGQLTEIDAAIVMLELCKQESELILLPAPPQFESAADKKLSADFIIIDPATEQTRGIQVKSYIDRFEDEGNSDSRKIRQRFKAVRKYSPDYITMVDGMIDLGNWKVRYSEHWGHGTVPDPGLLSLEYVHDSKNPEIARATGHIQERIMHDLQK
jgi:hypothetical protein